MKKMDFGEKLITLILLFALLGAFSFAGSLAIASAQNDTTDITEPTTGTQTWINYNTSNVRMTGLSATIHVTIKNNNDHVQYFKISQTYSQVTPTMNWTVDWTDPPASRMIDPVSPELGGDYGWEVQPGETKEVAFKLSAFGQMGSVPSWVYNMNAVDNTYWPLIPDMGLYASWFMPNEIEMLNPTFDLICWKGTFGFTATNFANYAVDGIIRGPIIPSDSKLTFSDPEVTYTDKEIALNTNVAAWNVHLAPDESQYFTYTYEWPISAGTTPTGGGACYRPTSTANATTTVPSRTTGVPYGLLLVAIVVVGAGIGYAKFLR